MSPQRANESSYILIEELSDLLKRYTRFTRKYTNQRISEFTSNFRVLKASIRSIQDVALELERVSANKFNVFQVLGVTTNEVRTHSAFLSELLRPNGTHGQGSLFLWSFLNRCVAKHELDDFIAPQQNVSDVDWYVEQEKSTGYGQLDIVVACPQLKYLFVIENKIFAGEQEDQLHRYAQWIKDSGYPEESRLLIYLTPDGRASVSHGDARYL